MITAAAEGPPSLHADFRHRSEESMQRKRRHVLDLSGYRGRLKCIVEPAIGDLLPVEALVFG
jgi:hypothetical protein